MKLRAKQTMLAMLLLVISSMSFGQKLTVGISLVDLSNPFFSILAEEISSQLKQVRDEKNVEILIHSSAYNLNKQVAQLGDFIDKQVDIIFVAASESEAIEPIIQKARQRGIIVVAVDIESAGADLIVTSDNIQAGYISCQEMIKTVTQASADHTGVVAIINGQPISSVINRVKGCKKAIAEHSNITLLSSSHNSSGTLSGGLESMTYLLIEYPKLQAVFTINDPSGLGAVEASKQLNRRDVTIFSVDGSPDFLKQITDSETNFIASAAQFPREMAKRAVVLALQKQESHSSGNNIDLIETELVTKDNASHFANWQKKTEH
jgi:ribose transport system substrate-binding protein